MRLEDDPTIRRIRDARHRISEECGHDARRLVEYYVEMERRDGLRPDKEAVPDTPSKAA